MVKNVEIWSTALGGIHKLVKENALELIAQTEQELNK